MVADEKNLEWEMEAFPILRSNNIFLLVSERSGVFTKWKIYLYIYISIDI